MDSTAMYQHFIDQATSTVRQAIGEDTAGNASVAVGLYVSATVLYMKALEYVQDEEFKKRVKVEVAKYLQRAQDLRQIEKQHQNQNHVNNEHQQTNNEILQQKLHQVQQQQQNFREQRQHLQEYWHAPPEPLPSHPSPSHPHPQPSHTQPQIPQKNSQAQTTNSQTPGLLGTLLNKVKSPQNTKNPQNPVSHKKARPKKQKAKKGSDDESEEDESSEEEEEEDEDEEGNERVEQLVKEVEREEGKGEDEGEEEEKDAGKKETETEYINEVPDEETLKTIDQMLVDEEKRVQAELKQTSVTDEKIADKIASIGYGLSDLPEGEVEDDVLKDLIMESRIEALGGGTTKSPKKSKAKKKPKS